MSPFEQIRQERESLEPKIAKLEALKAQYEELAVAERVLMRIDPLSCHAIPLDDEFQSGTRPQRVGRPRKDADSEDNQQTKPGKSELSPAILDIVSHCQAGADLEFIKRALAERGVKGRANHIVIALQRHVRGGRLEQRDGRWFSLAVTAAPDVRPDVDTAADHDVRGQNFYEQAAAE